MTESGSILANLLWGFYLSYNNLSQGPVLNCTVKVLFSIFGGKCKPFLHRCQFNYSTVKKEGFVIEIATSEKQKISWIWFRTPYPEPQTVICKFTLLMFYKVKMVWTQQNRMECFWTKDSSSHSQYEKFFPIIFSQILRILT